MELDTSLKFNDIAVGTYAVALAKVIRKDFSATEQRKLNIKDFSQLHDHTDANDYFTSVDYKLGWTEGGYMNQTYFDYISLAADLAFVYLNGEVALNQSKILTSF